MTKFNQYFDGSYVYAKKDNGGGGAFCIGKITIDGVNRDIKDHNKTHGIFFTANIFNGNTYVNKAGNEDVSRRTADLKRLNAVYCEYDLNIFCDETGKDMGLVKQSAKEALLSLETKPHFIIETKKGLHPLWLIDGNMTIDEYKNINERISAWSKINYGNGEPVKDVSRVLRLPDYYHLKDINDPFLIKLIYEFEGDIPHRYSKSELHKVFPKVLLQKEDGELKNNKFEVRNGSVEIPELFEGYRNNETTSFIGYLLAKSDPSIWEFIKEFGLKNWNKTNVSPPQDERDLIASFEQVSRNEALKRNLSEIPDFARTDLRTVALEQFIRRRNAKPFRTGYRKIDEKLDGGIPEGESFAVAGIAKSGKSSFVMKILQNKLDEGLHCAVINTELDISTFLLNMISTKMRKKNSDVTLDEYKRYISDYLDSGLLKYYGVESGGGLSVKDFQTSVEKILEDDLSLIVVDNITSYANSGDDESWKIVGKITTDLIRRIKTKKTVSLFVLHVNPAKVVVQQNISIKSKEKFEERMYDKDPVTYVQRPNLTHVYGGGQAHSQFSGSIIIHRPFQHYTEETEKHGFTKIYLDSIRSGGDASVQMEFNGELHLFEERAESVRSLL